MLDTTVESVKSALKRARAGLQQRRGSAAEREPAPAAESPAEDAIVAKFVNAYESADIDALVALLTDDVFMSMPPLALEYKKPAFVGSFCAGIFSSTTAGTTSCRHEPTVSPRSEGTWPPRPTSGTEPAS